MASPLNDIIVKLGQVNADSSRENLPSFSDAELEELVQRVEEEAQVTEDRAIFDDLASTILNLLHVLGKPDEVKDVDTNQWIEPLNITNHLYHEANIPQSTACMWADEAKQFRKDRQKYKEALKKIWEERKREATHGGVPPGGGGGRHPLQQAPGIR